MKNILTALLLFSSLIVFGQIKQDTVDLRSKHEVHLSLTGMGTFTHCNVGVDHKYRVNNWFKFGSGLSIGGIFLRKPYTQFCILPKAFVQFGYKWFWFEGGGEYNISLNPYAIHDQDKYFDCPLGKCSSKVYTSFSPYSGFIFSIGKNRNHELGIFYHPVFGLYLGGLGLSDPYFFGVKYRFRFKKISKKK